jgi:hypothetical protein
MPVLPDKNTLILDLETAQGPRKFLKVDDAKSRIEVVDLYEARPLPAAAPIDARDAAAAYDQALGPVRFDLSPVRPARGGRLGRAEGPLPHAGGRRDDDPRGRHGDRAHCSSTCATCTRSLRVGAERLRAVRAGAAPSTASWPGTKAVIGEIGGGANDIASGRTSDGIGYVASFGLTRPGCVERVRRGARGPGRLLGARPSTCAGNEGGDETLAHQMAAVSCELRQMYAKSPVRENAKDRWSSPSTRSATPSRADRGASASRSWCCRAAAPWARPSRSSR